MIDLPVCIFCGEFTDDWWLFDGSINACRCWNCLKNGVAETETEKAFFASLPTAPDEVESIPSPSSKFDMKVWEEYFSKGGRERLQSWVEESAKKKGYL